MAKKRKKKKRNSYQMLKKETWDWASRYFRLRDAKKAGPGIWNSYGVGYVMCYTCTKVDHIKNMQAGHFVGRGLGGHSGVYFDEHNVNTQCVQCNGFKGGNLANYEEHLIAEFNEEIVENLRIQHKIQSYDTRKLTHLLLYYQQQVENLLKELNILKWW